MEKDEMGNIEEEPLDKISKALGASRQFKLPKYEDGPLGWLHMAHDVAKIQEYGRQKAVMDAFLWQPNTEGVEPKFLNVTAPIPVYI